MDISNELEGIFAMGNSLSNVFETEHNNEENRPKAQSIKDNLNSNKRKRTNINCSAENACSSNNSDKFAEQVTPEEFINILTKSNCNYPAEKRRNQSCLDVSCIDLTNETNDDIEIIDEVTRFENMPIIQPSAQRPIQAEIISDNNFTINRSTTRPFSIRFKRRLSNDKNNFKRQIKKSPHYIPPTEVNLNEPKETSGKGLTCPICLDDDLAISRSGRQWVSTNCGHLFCKSCLVVSLKAKKECPKCRKKLSSKSFHPMFL